MIRDRRLANLGARRPWANPWAQVTIMDDGWDDQGGYILGLNEQVKRHGRIQNSHLAHEMLQPLGPSSWKGRRYTEQELAEPDIDRRPKVWEVWDGSYVPPIPVDIKAPPEPMWELEPWKTPILTEAIPKKDIKLAEIANMSECEFLDYLWVNNHHIAYEEYIVRTTQRDVDGRH